MKEEDKLQQVISSFRKLHQAFNRHMWRNADDLGVTTHQLFVLKKLEQRPEMSLGELARELNVNKSTMSGIVERLVKAGYVERNRCTSDRRALAMMLTAEGKKKKTEAARLYREKLQRILELPDEQLDTLLELHGALLEKITMDGDETHHESISSSAD